MALSRRVGAIAAAVCLTALWSAAPAFAKRPFAPLGQPGPALSVPKSKLKASLKCQHSVQNAKVEPVLLNPATGVTAKENFSWNWEPALDKLRIPWCAYTAPYETLGNIETSGEYLVYAIRHVYGMAHRRIAVLGHSQGGMSMRWALRFWPDTRSMVRDVIGIDGSNHGTSALGQRDCALEGCSPATWQQLAGSNFLKALNSRAETFAGISYTEIYSHTDEVVIPNSGSTRSTCSSCLFTGKGRITNVATQQICPLDVYEHLAAGTIDPVAYELGVDGLTHRGAAKVSRISTKVCTQIPFLMPGVNPLNLNIELQLLQAAPSLLSVPFGPLAKLTGAPDLYKEPALACYVYAGGCKKKRRS
jgi:hypothetical protein